MAGPALPSKANGSMPSAEAAANDTPTSAPGLSADEIALYDRQIRLWGAQAQERIRSANILLISLRALGTEIAKNLTLAGVASLTIIDDDIVTEEDLGAQYFLREEDVGKPRAASAVPRIQDLNPRVLVKSDGNLNDLLSKGETYYEPFQCIIACDHDLLTLSIINAAARFANRPFYAAGIHGFYGYIFADLFAHEYVVERQKSNKPTLPGMETQTRSVLRVTDKKERDAEGKVIEIVKKQEMYCPLILANTSLLPPDILSNRRKLKSVPALLPCLRALFEFRRQFGHLPSPTSHQDLAEFTKHATTKARELSLPPETLQADFLRSFLQNLGAEIVPTAAFVGGRLSEDVINVLGKREQPIQNFALFDGESLDGKIYCLYTDPQKLAMTMAGSNGMPDAGIGANGVMDAGMGMGMGMQGFGTDMGMSGMEFMTGGMGMDLGTGMDVPMNMAFADGTVGVMPGVGFDTAGGMGGNFGIAAAPAMGAGDMMVDATTSAARTTANAASSGGDPAAPTATNGGGESTNEQ